MTTTKKEEYFKKLIDLINNKKIVIWTGGRSHSKTHFMNELKKYGWPNKIQLPSK